MEDLIPIKSQNDLSELIFKSIIDDKKFKVLSLIGEEGSGKTTIIDKTIKNLNSNWQIHQILGEKTKTISQSQIITKKRFEFFPIPSLSFKLGIATLGGSMRFQEVDSIYSDIQKQFIKEIFTSKKNALVVIENYNLLDEETRMFINTLLCDKKLYDNCNKKVVFLFSGFDFNIKSDVQFHISKIDIKELDLMAKGMKSSENSLSLTNILELSNGNVGFAKNLIIYKSNFNDSLSKIISTRIQEISTKVQMPENRIRMICTYMAYFKYGFTFEQINLLLKRNNLEYCNSELELNILISNLEEKGLLNRQNSQIKYSNYQFKLNIKESFSREQGCFFKVFYEFFTNNYDYQYQTRLEYLYSLIKVEENNDLKQKYNGLIFSFLLNEIYTQTLNKNNFTVKINQLKEKYNYVIFPDNLLKILKKILNNTINLESLNQIDVNKYDELIKIEIEILKTNLMWQFNKNTDDYNKIINTGLEFLKENEEKSLEKYAMIRLRYSIFSQAINRTTLYDKFSSIHDKLITSLKNYEIISKDLYDHFYYSICRKSSMCYSCDESIKYLNDAASYFKESFNEIELFKTCVNLLGIYSLTSYNNEKNISELTNCLKKIAEKNIIKEFDKGKLINNFSLYEFILKTKICKTNEEYFNLANEYQKKFKNIYEQYGHRVSRLNYVSLLAVVSLENGLKETQIFLQENAKNQNFDEFYLYYLNSIRCFIYIIQKNWIMANKCLEIIKSNYFPIYNNNEEYCKKRIEALELIINKKIVCENKLEYSRLIYKVLADNNLTLDYYFGKDSSWEFYSMSFPMSDLQFYD